MWRRLIAGLWLLAVFQVAVGLPLVECVVTCADEGSEADCEHYCCRPNTASFAMNGNSTDAPELVPTGALPPVVAAVLAPDPREILHVPKPSLL